MHEEPKVFVIVFRRRDNNLEYLALKPNPEPGRNTGYYVITGGVESGEVADAAAAREVREEIGVSPIGTVDLHYILRYQDHITGAKYAEHCYGALIKHDVKKLNEEHIGYMWLDAETFLSTIWWDEDKADLRKMVNDIENLAVSHA